MAFTITYDKCGTQQQFKSGSSAHSGDISFDIQMSSHYQPIPEEIVMYCENPKCNSSVDMNY